MLLTWKTRIITGTGYCGIWEVGLKAARSNPAAKAVPFKSGPTIPKGFKGALGGEPAIGRFVDRARESPHGYSLPLA